MNKDDFVFYLTKERQGLFLGNKLILTVEQVQQGIKPEQQLSLDLEEIEDESKD